MGRLSLRLRVFLFFALLAGGALLISAGGLLFAGLRAEPALPAAPLMTAFVLFAFLNTALVLGVWLLFDENVAKPIIRLSADMRVRARGDVSGPIEAESARHLGDLAPALSDLSGTARATLQDVAAEVARETAQLGSEHARLTALLTEIPIATILLNPAQEIVLYDAQAAEILSVIAPPRLKAPVSDYLETREIEAAMARLGEGGAGLVTFTLSVGANRLQARLKALGGDGHLIFVDAPDALSPAIEARPLVFDFDLMDIAEPCALGETPLRDLCFVVLDLETTGLSVERDAIVQMAAVRALGGALVAGEELNTFVDPRRPIPPSATSASVT